MQTECSHCHTLFRITESHLEQADGQVQCGHCLAIFSALNPYENPHSHEASTLTADDGDNEIENPFDIDLGTNDVVPAELRITHPDKTYSALSSFFWSIGILVLISLGLAQYAYFQRYELIKNPALQAPLHTFCQLAGCDLPAAKDTSRIKLSSKNVYTHPNIEKALMITASIVNQAEFSQAFPILEVRFENIRGEIIAARRFKPSEYLNTAQAQVSHMQPGEPVSFNIEITDPGTDIVSYAFDFL